MRILLVDAHRILLDGLVALLDGRDGLEVVGVAANGREAVARARDLSPDLVVLEATLPGLNGADAARRIRRILPDVRFLVLSSRRDARTVARLLAARVDGYVVKSRDGETLLEAIREIAAGRVYLCPEVAGHAVAAGRGEAGPLSILTPREREVLQHVVEGLTSRHIADRLHVSPKTIDTHRYNLMRKLEVSTVAGLVRLAVREGLVPVER